MAIDRNTLLQEASCLICGGMSYADSIIVALLQRIAEGQCGPATTCEMLSGSGSPVGAQTPDFVGQLYHDTDADSYWRSTGLTSADWVEISDGGGTNGFVWGPSGDTLSGLRLQPSTFKVIFEAANTEYNFGQPAHITNDLIICEAVAGEWLTSVTMSALEDVGGSIIAESDTGNVLALISFPLLVSVGGDVLADFNLALAEIQMPLLQTVGADFRFQNNALTSITLPSLVSVGGGVEGFANPAMTTFSAPLWLPTDGTTIDISGCALDSASVNHILARCVASGVTTCTIVLDGGTNAAPTGQGIVDKADLITAGNTVTTN